MAVDCQRALSGEIDVVDPDKIRKLVEMMSENELSEICIKDGQDEIMLKRPGAASIVTTEAAPQVVVSTPQPAAASPAPVAAAAPAPQPVADADAGLAPIKSPMVGTFYAAPDPPIAIIYQDW